MNAVIVLTKTGERIAVTISELPKRFILIRSK